MVKILIRLNFVPDKNCFEFTLDDRQWDFTEADVQDMLRHARKQTADLTSAMSNFSLKFLDQTIILDGVYSQDAFLGIVAYLNKVWESYLQWKKKN